MRLASRRFQSAVVLLTDFAVHLALELYCENVFKVVFWKTRRER